jgi:hypothetical protein
MRMVRRNLAGLTVIRVLNRFPGVAFRMFRMWMMRTRQVWKWRLIMSNRRRVEFTLRAGHVGVVMLSRLPLMAGSFVMFFAFAMRKIVLRFFSYGTDTAETFFM